jgi:hypothetical protein
MISMVAFAHFSPVLKDILLEGLVSRLYIISIVPSAHLGLVLDDFLLKQSGNVGIVKGLGDRLLVNLHLALFLMSQE